MPNHEALEELSSNNISSSVKLTVCIPTYKYNPSALVKSLAKMAGAGESSLLIFDDGSLDKLLTSELLELVMAYPGPAQLITSFQNAGRSHARNRLEKLSQTDWILFLDADMLPDNEDFLSKYLHEISAPSSPAIVAGGFSLKQVSISKNTQLHAAQSLKSECLPATIRSKSPGQYVFTSNILTHKRILNEIPFDGGFVGWGWEDVDWGLRVHQQFIVKHIDNPATHLGLDVDSSLMEKYASSGKNFARVVSRNFNVMHSTPLYRAAKFMGKMPCQKCLQTSFAALARTHLFPTQFRLLALKLFRAACYAKNL